MSGVGFFASQMVSVGLPLRDILILSVYFKGV